jgi:hypothetical protein
MAAVLVEVSISCNHWCIFCDMEASVYNYSNGQEIIACSNCKDYKGIISLDEDREDLSEDDEGSDDE